MLPFESIDNDTDISIRTWARPTAVGLLPAELATAGSTQALA